LKQLLFVALSELRACSYVPCLLRPFSLC
jgi:hypothetical protein